MTQFKFEETSNSVKHTKKKRKAIKYTCSVL